MALSGNYPGMTKDRKWPEAAGRRWRLSDPKPPFHVGKSGSPEATSRIQPARLVAVREAGLMWANALRAFQVGKALASDERPWSWMRCSRVA
jgi:hypothetical protein